MNRWDLVVSKSGARMAGRQFPCSIGRGGIVPAELKREGDGATPMGTHRIVGVLYNASRLPRPSKSARAVGQWDRWSDDVRDPEYNHPVQLPHMVRHERLWRDDPLYDLVLVTDWNWSQTKPGKGSAIFVHRWRRPRFPTAGCVAFAPRDLLWIAKALRPTSRLVIE